MSRENNWVLLSVFFNHVKMWEVLNFNTQENVSIACISHVRELTVA